MIDEGDEIEYGGGEFDSLDTYFTPGDVLRSTMEAIAEILEEARGHGIFGVVALGTYDVLNDADMTVVRMIGSRIACKGMADYAVEHVSDYIHQNGDAATFGDDGEMEGIEA